MFHFWSPDVLKCQIYENGVLVNLNTLHETVLEELVDAIYPLWKTSSNSSIWYGIQVYEKRSLFSSPLTEIDIEAYIRDINRISGKKQVSINRLHVQHKIGKKFKIEPAHTAMKRWNGPVEVAFVV